MPLSAFIQEKYAAKGSEIADLQLSNVSDSPAGVALVLVHVLRTVCSVYVRKHIFNVYIPFSAHLLLTYLRPHILGLMLLRGLEELANRVGKAL